MPRIFPVVALLVLTACKDGGGDTDTEPPAVAAVLEWSLTGVEPLAEGFVYESWIVVDGTPLSAGRFNVDADGVPEVDAFSVTAAELAGTTGFILSIEPDEGDDPAPSGTFLLQADWPNTTIPAVLTVEAALGASFDAVAGPYILNTPTTEENDEDYTQGIWWLDPDAGPGPTLVLPTLPAGWQYEGWIVDTDMGVFTTTGRITAVDTADSDGAGPAAGDDPAPLFPGQDFIDPAMDLIGLASMISIEPEPDDSPDPYNLRPLRDADIEDVGINTLQDMAVQPLEVSGIAIFRVQERQQ